MRRCAAGGDSKKIRVPSTKVLSHVVQLGRMLPGWTSQTSRYAPPTIAMAAISAAASVKGVLRKTFRAPASIASTASHCPPAREMTGYARPAQGTS